MPCPRLVCDMRFATISDLKIPACLCLNNFGLLFLWFCVETSRQGDDRSDQSQDHEDQTQCVNEGDLGLVPTTPSHISGSLFCERIGEAQFPHGAVGFLKDSDELPPYLNLVVGLNQQADTYRRDSDALRAEFCWLGLKANLNFEAELALIIADLLFRLHSLFVNLLVQCTGTSKSIGIFLLDTYPLLCSL